MFSVINEKTFTLNTKVIFGLFRLFCLKQIFYIFMGFFILPYSSPPSVTGSRDYLQNLYDHLKGLAFVVAETEAKSSGMISCDS